MTTDELKDWRFGGELPELPERAGSLDELCEIYDEFIKKTGLPSVSADELIFHDELLLHVECNHLHAWLNAFNMLWDEKTPSF